MEKTTQPSKGLWDRLLPATDDVLVRGRAGLVLATCLGIILASWALVLTWLISGDLESVTAMAAGVFTLVLVGIGWLAHGGRARLSAWLLAALLTLLIFLDAWDYGLGSIAASGYVIPIALAASALGFWAGLGVAGIASASVWLLAWAETSGRYAPLTPTDISHLTFNAPAFTVIFLVVALLTGWWSRYLCRVIQHSTANTGA